MRKKEVGGCMNEIMEMRQQVRLNQWSAIVREREDSGLSVKAFCEQAGIATKSYYYRLRRLRENAIKQTLFGTIQTASISRSWCSFPSGRLCSRSGGAKIVIRTSDTTVEIPVNTNPEVVAASVSFLRQP